MRNALYVRDPEDLFWCQKRPPGPPEKHQGRFSPAGSVVRRTGATGALRPWTPKTRCTLVGSLRRYELYSLLPRTRAYVGKILKKYLRRHPPRSTQILCGSTNIYGEQRSKLCNSRRMWAEMIL